VIISITYIKLKTPFHFFSLAKYAMYIIKQLKADPNCQGHRQKGIWTHHYTMSKWNSEEDMLQFARSGAHLEAMKISRNIAAELKFKRLDVSDFPSWEEAKKRIHGTT